MKLLISLGILTLLLVNIATAKVILYPEPEKEPETPITPHIEYLPEDPIVTQPIVSHGHSNHKKIGTLYLIKKDNLISKIIGKELNNRFYKRVDNKYVEITQQEFRFLIKGR